MRIEDCPHCFMRVVPDDKNLCPSCRKSFSEPTERDPDLAAIQVGDRERLPPYCVWCDRPTEHARKLVMKAGGGGGAVVVLEWIAAALLLLISPFRMLMTFSEGGSDEEKRKRIEVEMPECRLCRGTRNPEILHADFSRYELKFLVSRDFKRRYEAISAQARPAGKKRWAPRSRNSAGL